MELASHNAAIPLPYDSEVEYVETPADNRSCNIGGVRYNGAFVDTGIVPKVGMTFRITGQFTEDHVGTFMMLCGVTDKNFRVIYRQESGMPQFQGPWWTEGFAGKPSFFTDKATYVGKPPADSQRSMPLFTVRGSQLESCSPSTRIFSWQVADKDGKTIQDFVPVRFTNEQQLSEAAFYDRISKKLFRNCGDREMLPYDFIAGPDVSKGGL